MLRRQHAADRNLLAGSSAHAAHVPVAFDRARLERSAAAAMIPVRFRSNRRISPDGRAGGRVRAFGILCGWQRVGPAQEIRAQRIDERQAERLPVVLKVSTPVAGL